MHLTSISEYKNELMNKGYDVEIIDYTSLLTNNGIFGLLKEKNIQEIHYCEFVDKKLDCDLNKISQDLKVKLIEYNTPGFLLEKNQIKKEFQGHQKHLMATFYKKQRIRFNILMDDNKPVGDKWSFDKENRRKLPKNIQIPDIPQVEYNNKILKRSEIIIEKLFKNHPGSVKGFNYPVNRNQAKQNFKNFLENRFIHFGDYEDAISSSNSFIFHSLLTPYLNIGLITPKEILELTMNFILENNIPINCLEGFIRQIIGWREFIRGIYEVHGAEQLKSNFWNFKNRLNKNFYNANTGLLPLDTTIDRVKTHGYAHHIERLMILGNIMLLLNIHPNHVYHWFMEYFVDAYDWVMVPNVYGMSQFADGGIMATKPYISGSNYLLKMSDYKKDAWCETWDALYWSFVDNNRWFFIKNPRMAMMVHLYDKKDESQKSVYKINESKIKEKLISLI